MDRQRKQEARIQLEFAVHAIHNPERSRLPAIALADGLALHTVSTERWLSASRLNATVELVLDALLPATPPHIENPLHSQ